MFSANIPLKDGFHDLTMGDYHALDAIGSSSIKAMRVGPPARVEWERANPKPDTDATILGTACHARILEPAWFEASYDVKPDGMRFNTKEGMAWRDDPVRAGKRILSHDVGATVTLIASAFFSKKPAMEAKRAASMVEKSMIWTHEATGLRMKGRPDFVADGYIYDLKVTREATESGLAFGAYKAGWMHQLAHYRAGMEALGEKVKGCRIVAISPKAPHFVVCAEVKDAALDMMTLDNDAALGRMAACVARNEWPGTPDDWIKIDPPATALADLVGMANFEEV